MKIFYFINFLNSDDEIMSFSTNSEEAYFEELRRLKTKGLKIVAKWKRREEERR